MSLKKAGILKRTFNAVLEKLRINKKPLLETEKKKKPLTAREKWFNNPIENKMFGDMSPSNPICVDEGTGRVYAKNNPSETRGYVTLGEIVYNTSKHKNKPSKGGGRDLTSPTSLHNPTGIFGGGGGSFGCGD